MKRILLIEDNRQHAQKTAEIVNTLKSMYEIEFKTFSFLPQNGDKPESHLLRITEFIQEKIRTASFDILMIDMLLGGDSTERPLGLQAISKLSSKLSDYTIVPYTEMSSVDLDKVKEFIKEHPNLHFEIISKPGNFQLLTDHTECVSKNKSSRKNHGDPCNEKRCNSKLQLICNLKCLYYELIKG